MKKVLFVLAVLALLLSNALAQDIVTVKPQRDPNLQCGFNFTFSNHNAAGKNIDEVHFKLISGNGLALDGMNPPAQWKEVFDGSGNEVDGTANNSGIAPNATLGGFVVYYSDPNFQTPVTIEWVALNSGTGLDSGTVQLTCTQYQSYTKLDTATVIPDQSGGDPCFIFTLVNRNSQGTPPNTQSTPIKYLRFQLLKATDGSMRPSKMTAAPGFVLDSVTTNSAFFHSNNVIDPGDNASGFKVCLRANPTSTKFSFVWWAYDDQGSLIDRDTVRDVPNTATSSNTESDIVEASAISGCLYTIKVKDFHVANLLPPSPIVKLILASKTPGITFTAIPSAPAKWKSFKNATSDTVTFVADSINVGIPGGIINSSFSVSVDGPTTTPFTIGWETDQPGSPFPSKVTTVSTGNLNLNCKVAVKATDSITTSVGIVECEFKATVNNSHNILPESKITTVTMSITPGSGQLTAKGTSNPTWNFSNLSATQIEFKSPAVEEALASGSMEDLLFVLAPKTAGTPVTVNWTTTDEHSLQTGKGSFEVSCSPSITICDTVTFDQAIAQDSCVTRFTVHNRKNANIIELLITPTNGWLVDTASTPLGWTRQYDGAKAFVKFTSTTGVKASEQQSFDIKFIAYHDTSSKSPDSFVVVAATTDINGKTCVSVDTVGVCLSHITTHGSVAARSEDVGVSRYMIRPNPTRGDAEISFEMNTQERVILTVLDVLGHQVKTLNSKILPIGSYSIQYNFEGLPDGTYYVRLQTPIGVTTKKLVLAR